MEETGTCTYTSLFRYTSVINYNENPAMLPFYGECYVDVSYKQYLWRWLVNMEVTDRNFIELRMNRENVECIRKTLFIRTSKEF